MTETAYAGAPTDEVTDLPAALAAAGVRFVHWKSNDKLAEALAGEGDLDLLVRREDASALVRTLARLGLKRVVDSVHPPYPAVEQYFGYDFGAERWLHLDIYYAITTGVAYLKEYHLPVEELLLSQTESLHGVPVPAAAAELVTMVIGQAIKRSSLLQLAIRKDALSTRGARAEIAALVQRDANAATRAELLVQTHLASLPTALWRRYFDALNAPSTLVSRYRLGLQVRACLSAYRRVSRIGGLFRRLGTLGRTGLRRGAGTTDGGSKHLSTGGAVIAVVGPEATGKSTLVAALASWLGGPFDVGQAHLGKPPATWVTAPISALLPLLRRWLPAERTSIGPKPPSGADDGAPRRRESMLFALRALMTAWERRSLARRLYRRAANGALVICDRYPSGTVGVMDGARLQVERTGSWWRDRAAALEQRLYREIPPPQLVLELSVPLEVAIERNRTRVKDRKESDQYLIERHTRQAVPRFPDAATLRFDTARDYLPLLTEMKEAVWRRL